MIVRLFKDQFAPLVRDGQKCQTVRPVPKRAQDIPKLGELFSARRWTGLPYRSKQEVLRESIVTAVMPVRIHAGGAGSRAHAWADWIDWQEAETREFAEADGFTSFEKMLAWFEKEHGLPFEGMVIFWASPSQLAQLKKLYDTEGDWWVRMKGEEWDDVTTLKHAGLIDCVGGDLHTHLRYGLTAKGRLVITELNVRKAL